MASASKVRQPFQKETQFNSIQTGLHMRHSVCSVNAPCCQLCLIPKLQTWLRPCRKGWNLWMAVMKRRMICHRCSTRTQPQTAVQPVLTAPSNLFRRVFMPCFHLPLLKEDKESLLSCPVAEIKCLRIFTYAQSSDIYFVYTAIEANSLWINK